jgi:hypothetical protein
LLQSSITTLKQDILLTADQGSSISMARNVGKKAISSGPGGNSTGSEIVEITRNGLIT